MTSWLGKVTEIFAKHVTSWAGSTSSTVAAFLIILAWTLGGFIEGFGTDYQMYVNTGTTIITFLMVFLIQRTQNKDSLALQMKLNELLAAHKGASNRLLNIEELSEEEILHLQRRYRRLATKAHEEDEDPTHQHTIEEIDPFSVQSLKKPVIVDRQK